MTAWAQMAESDKYYKALLEYGKKNKWQLYKRKYHADDHCVGQMYIDIYKKYKDPQMIEHVEQTLDFILENPPQTDLKMGTKNSLNRWNWCDALFMGPPVWAKLARISGEDKYYEYMNEQWWDTTNYLYDEHEHLFYRDSRFFEKRETNKEKVFWSRGNGWVLAGLVRVLMELPENYPDRPKYIKLYKEMAAKLVNIQPEHGLWHPSLLDPVSYPSKETSGTAFYTYGLAWGINHGVLDEEKYLEPVVKAWKGLVESVHPDGKLGFVQAVGASAQNVTANHTGIYGTGAFLLAGSEVYKLAVKKDADAARIVVVNPAEIFRDKQTIVLDWQKVKKENPKVNEQNIAVYDFEKNSAVVTQIVDTKSAKQLLFQTDLAPGEKKFFWIIPKTADIKEPDSNVSTYCRFVPERKDDFAWENDKIAFRMYGPGLWDHAVNSGVDCWLKRVDYPIINQWYAQMKEKTYHKDWGQGYDPYHVGKSAGCGGLRLYENNRYIYSNVFDEWKIIANGPIRSIFELTYDKSWKWAGKDMIETKVVTIDLGQQLFRFDCSFKGPYADDIEQVAVGITTHDGKAQTCRDEQKAIACCWEEIHGYGLATGSIVVTGQISRIENYTNANKDLSHIYTLIPDSPKKSITYYTGYGWQKAGEIETLDDWRQYLNNYFIKINEPVTIKYK
jgi:rhamnogalacturonyl hydrolase YesR